MLGGGIVGSASDRLQGGAKLIGLRKRGGQLIAAGVCGDLPVAVAAPTQHAQVQGSLREFGEYRRWLCGEQGHFADPPTEAPNISSMRPITSRMLNGLGSSRRTLVC